MTAQQALELIERLPYIRTLQALNDKILQEFLQQAVASDDPVEWVKAIKTGYIRRQNIGGAQRPMNSHMQALCQKAKMQLEALLSSSLGIAQEQLEHFIEEHLANEW